MNQLSRIPEPAAMPKKAQDAVAAVAAARVQIDQLQFAVSRHPFVMVTPLLRSMIMTTTMDSVPD